MDLASASELCSGTIIRAKASVQFQALLVYALAGRWGGLVPQAVIDDGLQFEVGPENLAFSVILDDGARPP
jgi:hypothetical protein